MQFILSALKQALRQNILVLVLMIFINLSGLFIFALPPSYAATDSNQTITEDAKVHVVNNNSGETFQNRERYEQAVEDPKDTEKTNERDVKAYKEANPKPNLLEKVEELVENVTGKA